MTTEASKNKYMTSEHTCDYERMLSHTEMSMKMYASSCYKTTEFLEINEIDRIKSALAGYSNTDNQLEEFKKGLIEDLTDFQKQIKTNHIQKIVDLTKQKHLYEKEVKAITEAYKETKVNFLQNIWSENVQKQEYEIKRATIQAKIEQLNQKLSELEKTKPIANAKDILMYRIHMKEKYSK